MSNPDTVAKIAYKPVGLVFSVLGGLLANVVFGQVWKRVSDAPTPPNATDTDYTTREVLLAALLPFAALGWPVLGLTITGAYAVLTLATAVEALRREA